MTQGWVQAVAIVTPAVVAILVTGMAGRSQLRLASQERKQARLEGAYRAVTAYSVRVRQYATVAHAGMPSDHPLLAPPLEDQELWETHSLVELYGSPDVRSAYASLLGAYAGLRAAVADYGEAKDVAPRGDPSIVAWRSDAREDFRRQREETLVAVEGLLRAIRSDLGELDVVTQ